MKARPFIVILIFSFVVLPLFSLEVKAGYTKIELFEDVGRFNISSITDEEKNQYHFFLDNKDLRTSLVTINVDNTVHILGESKSFQGLSEETGFGVRYVWYSRDVLIIEEFRILSANEVVFTLLISNVSARNLSIGAEYLFDTYLGENAESHFQTEFGNNITEEKEFTKKSPLGYWSTTDAETGSPEFVVFTRGDGITTPDRIILGNLYQLKKNLWKAKVSEGHILNDSAVAQFYDPVVLKPNESRKIVFALRSKRFAFKSESTSTISGAAENGTYLNTHETDGVAGSDLSGDADSKTNTEYTIDYEKLRVKLSLLNNLIDELNRRISEGKQFSAAERTNLFSLLKQLNSISFDENIVFASKLDDINSILIKINDKIKRGAAVTEDDISTLNSLLNN